MGENTSIIESPEMGLTNGHRNPRKLVRTVAVIGAGACGAIAAAALREEGVFDKIRVFERRSGIGGVWRYDPTPRPHTVFSGESETTLDPPLEIPSTLPATTPDNLKQDRWEETATYSSLMSNIPSFGMSFSDAPIQYVWPASPDPTPDPQFEKYKKYFGPYNVVQQYIADYFAQGTEDELVLGVTVEDITKDEENGQWRLVLRRPSGDGHSYWWEERFDAVVLANGRYYVPNIPEVSGLAEFQKKFPDVVEHSKFYRLPEVYAGKKVLVIGNRPSGSDIVRHLLRVGCNPIYQSKRTHYSSEPATAPPGVIWKTQITRYSLDGKVTFSDGTVEEGFDKIIYTTGYKFSLPFLQRYCPGISTGNRIVGSYLHTFYRHDPTLCFVGSIMDGVSFRGFEYQAIATARLLAGKFSLPSKEVMRSWEDERLAEKGDNRVFHVMGMRNAKQFWEQLRTLCGQPKEGEKGRRFPLHDQEFWDRFLEIYTWRIRDCQVPSVTPGEFGMVVDL